MLLGHCCRCGRGFMNPAPRHILWAISRPLVCWRSIHGGDSAKPPRSDRRPDCSPDVANNSQQNLTVAVITRHPHDMKARSRVRLFVAVLLKACPHRRDRTQLEWWQLTCQFPILPDLVQLWSLLLLLLLLLLVNIIRVSKNLEST